MWCGGTGFNWQLVVEVGWFWLQQLKLGHCLKAPLLFKQWVYSLNMTLCFRMHFKISLNWTFHHGIHAQVVSIEFGPVFMNQNFRHLNPLCNSQIVVAIDIWWWSEFQKRGGQSKHPKPQLKDVDNEKIHVVLYFMWLLILSVQALFAISITIKLKLHKRLNTYN